MAHEFRHCLGKFSLDTHHEAVTLVVDGHGPRLMQAQGHWYLKKMGTFPLKHDSTAPVLTRSASKRPP